MPSTSLEGATVRAGSTLTVMIAVNVDFEPLGAPPCDVDGKPTPPTQPQLTLAGAAERYEMSPIRWAFCTASARLRAPSLR